MNFLKPLNRWIIVLGILFALPLFARAQLTLEGEFRPRTEYRNGYRALRTASTKPAFFTSQRSRLTLRYDSDLYEIKVSGQDVRVWGEVDQLQDRPNVNIHEVWAKLNLSDALALKLGRQELVYDDHRLLGSVNWTQQARSHDALVMQYHESGQNLKIDLGGAYNQQEEKLLGNAYALNNYKLMSYIWINKNIGALDASIIGLTDGFEQSRGTINYRYTYGTHLEYNRKRLKLGGSVYLQNGDDALRRDISAWMVAIKAGYAFDALTLNAGMDYLSGGGVNDQNPQNRAFNTLYATNHKFYGNMDYFLNVPADSRFGGLRDIYLQTSFGLSDKSDISITYHNFALAEAVAVPGIAGGVTDNALGSEIDMNIAYRFSSDVSLKAGYSLMAPSKTLEQIRRLDAKDSQHWGWVMLSITPQLLK